MSSRIFVKGLPLYVNEARLKEHFSRHGDVTDVKLMRTRSGKSRRFAFIGFSSDKQAAKSIKFFNKSFMDTSRLVVETAYAPGRQPSTKRPWSRYSKGSSAHKRSHPDQYSSSSTSSSSSYEDENLQLDKESLLSYLTLALGSEKEASKLADDKTFREFLAVMKGRGTTKFWTNDDDDDDDAQGSKSQRKKELGNIVAKYKQSRPAHLQPSDGGSSDDEYDVNPVIDIDIDIDNDDEDDEKEKEAEKDQKKDKSKLSDMDFLRSKVVSKFSDSEDDSDDDGNNNNYNDSDDDAEQDSKYSMAKFRASNNDSDSNSDDGGSDSDDDSDESPNQEEEEEEEDEIEDSSKSSNSSSAGSTHGKPADIGETARLFIRNLSYLTSEDELQELFAPFGEISEVHIPLDSSNRSKGFGFVTFLLPEHAALALAHLDGTIYQGRLLHIMASHAKPAPKDSLENMDDTTLANMSYKRRKELQMKQEANKADNWNSLFIRSDTVADAISNKYGVEKGELLDQSVDNMAVRLALAESHLIKETKEFLAENGVSTSVFEQSKKKTKRSKTTILVKNIPFSCDGEEVRNLFAKFGNLGRVVLPPSKTMAMVEFLERADARRAFARLAFKKFKDVPLYLEWAPEGVFSAKESENDDKKKKTLPPSTSREVKSMENDDGDVSNEVSKTIFVKNLNFDTTEAALRAHFAPVGRVISATIGKKKNTKTRGPEKDKAWLSLGYGFVEYTDKNMALDALKKLQKSQLDGHILQLKLSGRKSSSSSSSSSSRSKSKSKKRKAYDVITDVKSGPRVVETKIVVKNLPFEATRKDVRELFGAFGQVKKVRIPRKFNGQHRGFAFVEFLTKQEASNAFKALAHTHLYGRHLVLSWALPDENLQDIRAKTIRQFRGNVESESAKRRKLKKL